MVSDSLAFLFRNMILEVGHHLPEGDDHVVDLDAVDEVGVVPEFGLDSVELAVEFFEIRELNWSENRK